MSAIKNRMILEMEDDCFDDDDGIRFGMPSGRVEETGGNKAQSDGRNRLGEGYRKVLAVISRVILR